MWCSILPDILVDTCGWVATVDAGINIDFSLKNIFGKYQLLLLPSVKSELELISNERSAHQPLLLDLLYKKSKNVNQDNDFPEYTDDQLVFLSNEYKIPVLTVDRELKSRLHDLNLPVVQVTGNNRLELIE